MPVSLSTDVSKFTPTMYVFHPGARLPDIPELALSPTTTTPVNVILRDRVGTTVHATVDADQSLYKTLQVSGGDFGVSYDINEREFSAISLYADGELRSYALHEVSVEADT